MNLHRRRFHPEGRESRPGGFGLPDGTSEAQSVSSRHWCIRYLVALAAPALTAALHFALANEVQRSPFLLYVLAVVVSGIYGGFLPGLTATALSAVAAVEIATRYPAPVAFGDSMLQPPLVIFVVGSAAICYVAHGLHAAVRTLRGNEQRFRSIVEGVRDYSIFMLNARGFVSSWNPGAVRITGYSSGDIVGRHFSVFFPPEELKAGKPENILRRAEEDGSVEFEDWHVRKDGSRFWANVLVTAIRDESGDLIGFSKITRDLTERKAAEEAARERARSALEESEAKYRTLFNSMDEGFCIIEVLFDARGEVHDYRFLETNPAFDRQTGLAGAVGKTMRELAPGHESHWFEAYGRVARTGAALRFEQHARELGRWYEVHAWRYGDAARRRVAVLFNDITARKRSEETIRENAARLRLFFEHAPVELAMFDTEMRYLAVSDRWMAAYGLAGRDVIGMNHYAVFPDVPERWKEVHRRALRGEVIRAEEEPFQRADGTVQWVRWEVRPWRHAGGGVGGIIIFSEEITERKRAREAIRRSERQLRTIIDEMPALISYIDRDGRYVFNNRRYAEWWGKRPEALAGTPARDLVGPEIYARYEPLIRKALAGESAVFECEIAFKDRKRWIRSEFVPDRDPDGQVRGLFVFGTDVTEAKRSSEELAQAVRERTKQLRKTVEELESFSYTVSHDLRAPLRAIQGYAYIVLERARSALDPESADLLRRIEKSSSRMDRLVKDVLVFSEIGREPPQMAPVNLDAIVEHVAKNYEGIRAAGVRVASPLGRVRGQDTLLTQIVSNLLENAVKFVPEGRPAEVSVWSERPAAGVLRLVVEDRGIGIPAEHQGRVFHPFVRLTSGRYSGTGIGLAIVKRAAEAMGGQVGLSSAPGKGSRFWIDLTEADDGR